MSTILYSLDILCIYNLCHLSFQYHLPMPNPTDIGFGHWLPLNGGIWAKATMFPFQLRLMRQCMFWHEHGVISWTFMINYMKRFLCRCCIFSLKPTINTHGTETESNLHWEAKPNPISLNPNLSTNAQKIKTYGYIP